MFEHWSNADRFKFRPKFPLTAKKMSRDRFLNEAEKEPESLFNPRSRYFKVEILAHELQIEPLRLLLLPKLHTGYFQNQPGKCNATHNTAANMCSDDSQVRHACERRKIGRK
jgi:hypothetical protein